MIVDICAWAPIRTRNQWSEHHQYNNKYEYKYKYKYKYKYTYKYKYKCKYTHQKKASVNMSVTLAKCAGARFSRPPVRASSQS